MERTTLLTPVVCMMLLSISNFFDFNKETSTKLGHELNREGLINQIVENEKSFAEARCHCRIGNDRGSQLNSYDNPLHDLGMIHTYNRPILNPDNQENDDDCGRRCSQAAANWANSLTNDQLCAYAKKTGNVTIVAYAKVGTKKWSIRQTLKSVNCCQTGNCPSGWTWNINAQKCAKELCRVASDIPGGAISLGNFGFVHGNVVYQMVPGSVIFKECR